MRSTSFARRLRWCGLGTSLIFSLVLSVLTWRPLKCHDCRGDQRDRKVVVEPPGGKDLHGGGGDNAGDEDGRCEPGAEKVRRRAGDESRDDERRRPLKALVPELRLSPGLADDGGEDIPEDEKEDRRRRDGQIEEIGEPERVSASPGRMTLLSFCMAHRLKAGMRRRAMSKVMMPAKSRP
jgi:hypothetical protein